MENFFLKDDVLMGNCTRREFLKYMSMVAVPLIVPKYAIPELPPPPTPLPPKDPNQSIKRNPYLGIRNDIPTLMKVIPEMGASMVRIAGDRENFYVKPQVKQAIEVASREKLDILYTYNPQRPVYLSQIRRQMADLISLRAIDAIEFGNEPDNLKIPFWQNQDLRTLAVFVLVASDQVLQMSPATRVGIGAFVDSPQLDKFLTYALSPDYSLLPNYSDLTGDEKDYLHNIRFDPRNFFYSIHAYHEVDDVIARVETTREILRKIGLQKPQVWMTEVGTDNPDKRNVPKMLDAFFATKGIIPEKALIHELPKTELFGFVDPHTGSRNPLDAINFSAIVSWSQKYHQVYN